MPRRFAHLQTTGIEAKCLQCKVPQRPEEGFVDGGRRSQGGGLIFAPRSYVGKMIVARLHDATCETREGCRPIFVAGCAVANLPSRQVVPRGAVKAGMPGAFLWARSQWRLSDKAP
jgi:hypothetical protein